MVVVAPRLRTGTDVLGPTRLGAARLALSRVRSGPWLIFWIVIVAILVLPILLFLLVAVSPRAS